MAHRDARRRREWWVVAVTAGLAVLVLVLTNNLQQRPVDAEIVAGSESAPDADGLTTVSITWSFRTEPELVESAQVRVSPEQAATGTVPVWSNGDDGFTLDDPRYELAPGDFLVAGILGALLGVVMVMSIRGFGYVRGTGEPGSKPSVDVAEDRGFYWRT